MLTKLRARLTYANVMLTVLAFIVLGGITQAATGGNFILGNPNSAGSTTGLSSGTTGPALKVTSTGTTAGATALGLNVASGHAPFTVNSGTKVANLNADKLDGLDSTAFARNGSEPWHEVGAWGGPEPAFHKNDYCYWTNFDSYHNTAAFLRDRFGFVHLKGLVQAGDLGSGCNFDYAFGGDYNRGDGVIFQLPDGYRPALRGVFATLTNGALARVNVDGPLISIYYYYLGPGAVSADPLTTEANAKQWLSLDGISFRCAPSGSNGCP